MFLTDKSSASSFYPHQSSSPTWSSRLLPAQRGRRTRSRRMTRQSMMTTRKSCSQEGCTHGVIKEGGECVSSHMAQRWSDALWGMYQLCQKGRSLRYTWHANKVGGDAAMQLWGMYQPATPRREEYGGRMAQMRKSCSQEGRSSVCHSWCKEETIRNLLSKYFSVDIRIS